jgi:DNA-binding transcriptional LysR family regulator
MWTMKDVEALDLRWFRVLVELADLGTLRAVADLTGYSTSALSQQLGALQRALGSVLVEQAGRRLQLTPAGRALLPHARNVLATLDAARGELGTDGIPAGQVRLASYATALLARVVPALRRLREAHPGLTVAVQEREPDEVAELLGADAIDVGLVYEYSLVPRDRIGVPFGEVEMRLVVPRTEPRGLAELLADPGTSWITNSRAQDDDELIARVGARFGARPAVTHRIDSLYLLVEMVQAGLGVALIAGDGPRHPGVRYLPLDGAAGTRTGYARTRPGRERWPANAVLIEAITRPLPTLARGAQVGGG